MNLKSNYQINTLLIKITSIALVSLMFILVLKYPHSKNFFIEHRIPIIVFFILSIYLLKLIIFQKRDYLKRCQSLKTNLLPMVSKRFQSHIKRVYINLPNTLILNLTFISSIEDKKDIQSIESFVNELHKKNLFNGRINTVIKGTDFNPHKHDFLLFERHSK